MKTEKYIALIQAYLCNKKKRSLRLYSDTNFSLVQFLEQ